MGRFTHISKRNGLSNLACGPLSNPPSLLPRENGRVLPGRESRCYDSYTFAIPGVTIPTVSRNSVLRFLHFRDPRSYDSYSFANPGVTIPTVSRLMPLPRAVLFIFFDSVAMLVQVAILRAHPICDYARFFFDPLHYPSYRSDYRSRETRYAARQGYYNAVSA